MKARHEVWLVEWFDAFDVCNSWTGLDSLGTANVTVQSVGFLIDPAPIDGYLTLVTSDDGDGSIACGINIPLVNVIDMVRLKRK